MVSEFYLQTHKLNVSEFYSRSYEGLFTILQREEHLCGNKGNCLFNKMCCWAIPTLSTSHILHPTRRLHIFLGVGVGSEQHGRFIFFALMMSSIGISISFLTTMRHYFTGMKFQ